MKVFLSWSKQRSKKVAELLAEWIPCVIQAVDPWVSSQNIEDGELWFTAIQSQVEQIINGVICLTQENKAEPWILFEAGGLAKGLEKSRVYILLIDLTSSDILLSPLSGFNHTRFDKDGIKKLLHVINGRTTNPIATSVLDKVFDKFWPDLEQRFNDILQVTEAITKEEKTKTKAVSEIENDLKPLLEEILKVVRGQVSESGTTKSSLSPSDLRNLLIVWAKRNNLKFEDEVKENFWSFNKYIRESLPFSNVSDARLAHIMNEYCNELPIK